MDMNMSDLLMVRDRRARCRKVARPCQCDTVKKDISYMLAVIPTVPLVVVILVANIISGTKKL
jgi:hypothetical protein